LAPSPKQGKQQASHARRSRSSEHPYQAIIDTAQSKDLRSNRHGLARPPRHLRDRSSAARRSRSPGIASFRCWSINDALCRGLGNQSIFPPWRRCRREIDSANRSPSHIGPVSGMPKRKLENGERRLPPQSHQSRGEIPEFASQRLGRASLTRGNVGGSHTRGNRIVETALAGWGGRIRTSAWRNRNPLRYRLRPAQPSLTLRPVGSLSRRRRPLSRGSGPASYSAEPLVSYRINRQVSGWNLPPPMIRAVGAHGQILTWTGAHPQHRGLVGAPSALRLSARRSTLNPIRT
jgi:hypothetical protein